MKTVIILSGKKSTGKDTSFGFIRKILANRFSSEDDGFKFNSSPILTTKKSYADPLKELCKSCFGLTDLQCYGESDERKTNTTIKWRDLGIGYPGPPEGSGKTLDDFLTARDVLQLVGTNVMRDFYPGIWANAAKLAVLREERPVVVFTDARFPDEIEVFEKGRDAGKIKLITIRLYRDTGYNDTHLSETALDDWDTSEKFDYAVENNGTLEELREAMAIILREHFDGILG